MALPGPRSIAILPFVDMSRGSEYEYFCDGITEEIILALTKVEGIAVTARTSSYAFKNTTLAIPEIGAKLGVSSVLEGSIRVSANKVRITVQLIKVTDGFHFWSDKFDRSMDDIFAVQDEISLLIADKLRENLGHFDIEDGVMSSYKIPIAVYKSFLKAKFLARQLNKPDAEEALSLLLKVIESVPTFPLAFLEIHAVYSFLGYLGVMPSEDAFKQGHVYLQKAIALAPDLPECQYQLAQIQYWQKWDWEGACQLLAKAIQQQPSYADAHQLMGLILISRANYEAAQHYQNTALRLNPFDATTHYHRGVFYYFQEKYEAAKLAYEKSLALDPEFLFSQVMIAAIYLLQGRFEEGLTAYQNLPASSEKDLSKLQGISLSYAMLGNTEKVGEGIEHLEKALDTPARERALIFLILVYAVAGNEDRALEVMDQAIQERLPMLLLLHHEPLLKKLRSKVGFQDRMKQVFGAGKPWKLPRSKKYKKSPLKEEDMSRYKSRLAALMSDQEPYLDPRLSLRSLAQLIPLHPNYLSQLLNECFSQNFAEYINTYRIEAFKGMVADPAKQHLTLLAMAFDSGFNSKTAFNSFFKKTMGKTPKAYWKEVVKK